MYIYIFILINIYIRYNNKSYTKLSYATVGFIIQLLLLYLIMLHSIVEHFSVIGDAVEVSPLVYSIYVTSTKYAQKLTFKILCVYINMSSWIHLD